MVSKKPKKTDSSFELGNLTLFGFNLDELVKKVSGHSLGEIVNNPKLAQEIREQQKEHSETQSFEKKFGNTSVSYRVTKSQLGTKPPTLTTKEQEIAQLKAKEEQDKAWEQEEEKQFGKTKKKK